MLSKKIIGGVEIISSILLEEQLQIQDFVLYRNGEIERITREGNSNLFVNSPIIYAQNKGCKFYVVNTNPRVIRNIYFPSEGHVQIDSSNGWGPLDYRLFPGNTTLILRVHESKKVDLLYDYLCKNGRTNQRRKITTVEATNIKNFAKKFKSIFSGFTNTTGKSVSAFKQIIDNYQIVRRITL